jgi:acyl carrier protein
MKGLPPKMEREEILELINRVLANREKGPVPDDETPIADVGFRSLDFSEVALRIEDEVEHELNFSAASMRRITTIRDVIDFLISAARMDAPVS